MTTKAFVLAILAVSALSGQKKPDPCKVSGRLTNSVTNEPVRKAKVSLHPDDPSKTVYTVESDAEGKFHLDNIDPGRYTLEGEKAGFVTGWYGETHSSGTGTTIDLKPGKDSSELAVKLTPQGIIAGRVLDEEGEPVSGVMVMALHYMYMNGHRQLVPAPGAMQIQTNDLGEYRVASLPPGRYYVQSSAQSMANFQASPVKRQDNAPELGYVPVYFPNVTDAASASPVEVGPGIEVRGIDLKLKKIPVQTVTGKAMDGSTGQPLKTGVLLLYRRTPGVMSVMPSGMFMLMGGKGDFEMHGLAPGEYNVMAMADADPTHMSMSHLDVGDQPVKDVVLNLGGGADVPITVRMPAGANPSIDPSTIRVMLQVDDNPMASLANVPIGKDGAGVLKKVNPDRYKVEVMGIPPDYYLQGALMGSNDVLENGLDVRNGVAGPLELTIGTPAAKLSGTVKNDKDELAKGVTVTVIAKDPKWRTNMSQTATTDQNGHFEVRGLVPAEYRVYAWSDIEPGAAEDEEFRKPYERYRADVDLSRGSPGAPIELKLISVETRR